MANSNWAKVYLNDDFAGYLEEQPGGRTCFTYDESFIQSSNNPVSVKRLDRLENKTKVHFEKIFLNFKKVGLYLFKSKPTCLNSFRIELIPVYVHR
jgi:hypothetical protein